MDSRCKQRSHDWDRGPFPGSTCKRRGCGKRYAGKGKRPTARALTPKTKATPPPIARPAPTPGEAQAVPEPHTDKFGALAERWGRVEDPQPDEPIEDRVPPELVEPDEPEPEPEKPEEADVKEATLGELSKVAAPIATQLMVGLSAGIIRWAGREPNKPDPVNLAELQKCWELFIKLKFPEIKVSPFGGICLYGGLNAAGMWMGAQKIPKPDKPKLRSVPPAATQTPTAAPTAATPATADGGEESLEPPEPNLRLVLAEEYARTKRPKPTTDPFAGTTDDPGSVTSAPGGQTDQ
jgi:hypothetical protein